MAQRLIVSRNVLRTFAASEMSDPFDLRALSVTEACTVQTDTCTYCCSDASCGTKITEWTCVGASDERKVLQLSV